MSTVLLVADKRSTTDRVQAALAGADVTVIAHEDPKTAPSVAYGSDVDAIIVDMQVAAMGAMAVTRAIRAAAQDDQDPIPVTILLDREADAFLARRAGASTWVGKDFAPNELRAAVGVG